MSVTYHTVLRGIAHQVGALRDSSVPSTETSYVATPLTAAELALRGNFSLTVLKDALLAAEEAVVNAIGVNLHSPFRTYILSVTAALASNAVLPKVDTTSQPIIGSWGAVTDSSDGTVLIRQPVALVKLRIRNAGSQFKIPSYIYDFVGDRIIHTRTNVLVQCCIYNRATQATAVTANSAMLLPDSFARMLVAGGASFLKPDSPDTRLFTDYVQNLLGKGAPSERYTTVSS